MAPLPQAPARTSAPTPAHEPQPPWLHDVRRVPSLRARALSALLRRTVKASSERLDGVTPGVVRASRRRLTRIEPRAARWAPRARIEHVDMDGLPAERVSAPGASADHTVLLLHGGGYAVGSPALYRGLAARVSHAAACTVLVPAYRLAPEHPFPAALEDANAAWAWITERSCARASAVVGDSAGGGLALALLGMVRDAGGALPAAGVAMAPWTDLTHGGASLHTRAGADAFIVSRLMPDVSRLYLAGADPADPRASPLFGRHDGLPPLLIQVSDSEVLHDDAVRYAASVSASGASVRVERWAGLPHAFQLFAPVIPEAAQAIAHIGRFLRRCWSEADDENAAEDPARTRVRLPSFPTG